VGLIEEMRSARTLCENYLLFEKDKGGEKEVAGQKMLGVENIGVENTKLEDVEVENSQVFFLQFLWVEVLSVHQTNQVQVVVVVMN
jgi:hypothetical protein